MTMTDMLANMKPVLYAIVTKYTTKITYYKQRYLTPAAEKKLSPGTYVVPWPNSQEISSPYSMLTQILTHTTPITVLPHLNAYTLTPLQLQAPCRPTPPPHPPPPPPDTSARIAELLAFWSDRITTEHTTGTSDHLYPT